MSSGLLVAMAAAEMLTASLFGTRGSGTLKEETRNVPDFTSVEIGSGLEAEIALGPKTSVTLKGDDNLLPMIKTEVKDGRLSVGVESISGISPSQRIHLNIVTPKLASVGASGGARISVTNPSDSKFAAQASGGGRVSMTGLHLDALRVSASGGGTVEGSGAAKALEVELSGGATLKATEIPADSMRIDASGGSRAFAQVASEITGSMSGGASLHLKGHPKKHDVETSGGSRVKYDE